MDVGRDSSQFLILSSFLTKKDEYWRQTEQKFDFGDSETSITRNKMRGFTLEPYPMNVPGRKRGLAFIFSHKEYDKKKQPSRNATECDNNRLTSLLENFGFEVKLCQDYKMDQIFSELSKASEMDHSNYECFALFVMTHGKPGELAAYDTCYEIGNLWYYFTKEKCPTLKGKPKLFFVQACRGNKTDAGFKLWLRSSNCRQSSPFSSSSFSVPDTRPTQHIVLEHTVLEHTEEFDTPNEPDFLVAYSTVPGYYSYNDLQTGSWFIQKFCHVLENYGRKYDLLTLLTFVAQCISYDCQSSSKSVNVHEKKQIPSIVYTLERPLYFFPSEMENVSENLELL